MGENFITARVATRRSCLLSVGAAVFPLRGYSPTLSRTLCVPGSLVASSPGSHSVLLRSTWLQPFIHPDRLPERILLHCPGRRELFQGTVGRMVFRRFDFLLGNTLQTLIFLLPHFLTLLAGVYLWPLLVFPVILGWLNGWLRYKSDSILPGMLVHGLGNTLSDALAMWLA
jgi:CAAX prenyl protease-like protein